MSTAGSPHVDLLLLSLGGSQGAKHADHSFAELAREAAQRLGVSFNTVRNQMTRIFEKTQTHKQSDLLRLIMRTMGVGGR